MKRTVLLGALIAVGALALVAAQPQQQGPKTIEVEKVKDNLYMLKGGGGNTAVFLGSNGVVVVDAKNPGWGQPILDEIKKLMDHDIVKLIDLLVVHKNDDGTFDKVEISDIEELTKLGATAGALLGFGEAGEEGAEVGAVAGAEAVAGGSMFDETQVWYVADAIPAGMTAAIAVLEHRWAIPLREAIARSGGVALADEWIHPEDLVALGIEAAAADD